MTDVQGLTVSLQQQAPIPLTADFACAAGEVLALVGPSGSGKSTILRSIAGTYRPQAGHVRVNSETWLDSVQGICQPAHRRAVGMVFQSYALFPHMTALGNIMTAMPKGGQTEQARRGRELLELVHLSGLEARYPAQLSGGQQQRVAVARALARQPKALLLDEPFSAVDKATRQRLYREIAQLHQTLDMPVVLVTHDLDEALMLADRLVVLHRGRTLQSGAPEEVITRPVSPEVARLVELRNLFEGRVRGLDGRSRQGVLKWAGLSLEVTVPQGVVLGDPVHWVIPDGFVVLHRRDRPSRGERENPVPGVIGQALKVGQTAHITLYPDHAPDLPLHFSVPQHVAQRNGIETGVQATVSLLTKGIHLMPRTSVEEKEAD